METVYVCPCGCGYRLNGDKICTERLVEAMQHKERDARMDLPIWACDCLSCKLVRTITGLNRPENFRAMRMGENYLTD